MVGSPTIKEMFWNTSHADFVKITHITTSIQPTGYEETIAYMWREDGTIISNDMTFSVNKSTFPFMSDKNHAIFKKMKDLFIFKNEVVVAVDEDNTAYVSKVSVSNRDWYKSDDTDNWTRDCSNQDVNPAVDYRIYPNIKDVCMPMGATGSATDQGPINMIDTDGNLFGCASVSTAAASFEGRSYGALMYTDNSSNLISRKWDSLYPGYRTMWALDTSGGIYLFENKQTTAAWNTGKDTIGNDEATGFDKTYYSDTKSVYSRGWVDLSSVLSSGVSVTNSHCGAMSFIKENGDVYSTAKHLNAGFIDKGGGIAGYVFDPSPAALHQIGKYTGTIASSGAVRLNLGAGSAKGSKYLESTENRKMSFSTYHQKANFANERRSFKRGAAAAEEAGFYNTTRVAALQKAVVTQTVGGKKRAKKDDTDLLAALAAMKAEIASGTASGANSKKKKRRAALKLIFEATAGVVQIPMKKTDLELPDSFKKTDVVVVKAGQTIDVTDIEGESETKDTGFYAVLDDGQNVSLTISGKTFTVKRVDVGGEEQYIIDNSGGAVFTETTGCDYWDNTIPHLGYLVDDDIFTAEGHTFFIGSVGDGNENQLGNTRTITVGAKTGGDNAFYYGGDEAPTLIMTSGNTYTINHPAEHPFRISELPDGNTPFNLGVNIISSTQLTFTVTNTTPSTLYYYCSQHSGMGAMIDVQYGASGGDPYVKPMKGPTYKLPNKKAYYRLYEKDDVFINGSVKEIDESRKKSIQKYFKNLKSEVNPIVDDGYFYSSYYMSVGDKKFVIDLKTFVFLTSNNAKDFFTFKMTKENVKGSWDNGKALCLNVTWKRPGHGFTSLDIMKYENPQIDSSIRMKHYPSIENTVGALVRNYKPKLMEIEKLDSTKVGKIARKLKKAKNKFTNKAYMSNGETWTIDGKTYNFNQVNKKI